MLTRRLFNILVFFAFNLMLIADGFSQPVPGDVFREYSWYNIGGDAGQALRVGGKLDYGGNNIELSASFDLEHAIKAEVVIEKILCHDGTKNLEIQINDESPILVPEAEGISIPQWDYQHHIYPVVPVQLYSLKHGPGNKFKLRVDPQHPWGWPQNLIYGVIFRVYYEASAKPHATGNITTPTTGQRLSELIELTVQAQSPNGRIKQVDYIGYYEDINFEGDGNYRQWHYHYLHGQIKNHIGTSNNPPYSLQWNTSWIPDQIDPMMIAARIVDETGLIYMTEAVKNLSLDRQNHQVELCKPYDIPKQWVTRKGEKFEKFHVKGDLSHAKAAQLVWISWCPCYMNGIFINGNKVFNGEGPCYDYDEHWVILTDMSVFKCGENVLKTGGSASDKHGMEVQWPGIMVLIQYDKAVDVSKYKSDVENVSSCELQQNYPNPFNQATQISFDIAQPEYMILNIYDISGRLIKTLINKYQEAGSQTVEWDGQNDRNEPVSSGIYFIKLQVGNKIKSRKAILLK